MKKIIVLLLSICMAACALSGCSPTNTETMDSAQAAIDKLPDNVKRNTGE